MASTEDRPRLADRFGGALLGGAIGGALGALRVGASLCAQDMLADWANEPPHPLNLTQGTHRTLATARSFIECRGFDAEHLTTAIEAQLEPGTRRDRSAGAPRVGGPTHQSTESHEAAGESVDAAGPVGNEAATRMAPIGLLHFRAPARAAEVGRDVARITHSHPLGEDGAALQAAAVAELLRSSTQESATFLAQLGTYVRTRWFRELVDKVAALDTPPAANVVKILGNGNEAHRSVGTALHAFLRHRESFTDSILFALSLGGATEAIGAMTGALAGAALGASAIPSTWIDMMSARHDIVELADKLFDLALGQL